jgi:hypothetical protein
MENPDSKGLTDFSLLSVFIFVHGTAGTRHSIRATLTADLSLREPLLLG